MYQFALDSYIVLFLISIAKSPKSDKIEERLKNLNEYHTHAGRWLGVMFAYFQKWLQCTHACMRICTYFFATHTFTYLLRCATTSNQFYA